MARKYLLELEEPMLEAAVLLEDREALPLRTEAAAAAAAKGAPHHIMEEMGGLAL